MKRTVTFLTLALALVVTSCNVFESSTPDTLSFCKTEGTVKDFTGLDGCGLLIVMKDGTKLIPVSIPDNFELKDGQTILFDYEETPMANICMAGTTVKVTCIKEIIQEGCDHYGPLYIVDPVQFEKTSKPTFTLFGYEYSDGSLTLDIGYSGCSPKRDFSLVTSTVATKSIPPQRPAILTFREEMCEAWFRQKICIDVSILDEKTDLMIQDGNQTHKVTVGY